MGKIEVGARGRAGRPREARRPAADAAGFNGEAVETPPGGCVLEGRGQKSESRGWVGVWRVTK